MVNRGVDCARFLILRFGVFDPVTLALYHLRSAFIHNWRHFGFLSLSFFPFKVSRYPF